MNIRLPLQIENGQLAVDEKMKQSINKHLDALLNTRQGTVVCDPDYGFELASLRFENFDENSGTVFTSEKHPSDIYKKKLSGSSKNLQTFAAEFNKQLAKYEPRITDTTVVMNYIREEKKILLIIRGRVRELDIPYQYQTSITVWRK